MARISDRELELRAKARWREDKQIWQLNVTPKGQKRTSFYSKIPGDRGRNEAASKAIQYLNIGMFASPEKVESNYAAYLDFIKENRTLSYLKQPKSFGANWVLPHIGYMRLSDVTDDHIQAIITAAADKGLTKKTLRAIRNETYKFFKWCKRHNKGTYIPPFTDVDVSEGTASSEKVILTPEETLTLFESDMTMKNMERTKDPLIHLYRFLVLTGIRIGEALTLTPEDFIDDFRKTIVCKALNEYGEVTGGKTVNAKRTLVNCQLAVEELKAQALEFPAKGGESFWGCTSHRYVRDRLEVYCACNGIQRITPYNFRHTFESYRKRPENSEITQARNQYVGHSKEISSYIHEVEHYPTLIAKEINQIFLEIFEYAKINRKNRGTGVVQA